MKKHNKKLRLSSDTIRQISVSETKHAIGGYLTGPTQNDKSCGISCGGSCLDCPPGLPSGLSTCPANRVTQEGNT